MKPENGIKERIAERNNVEDNRESEESKETEEFILVAEQQSWQEAVDIIATKGSVRRIKI